MRLGVGERLPRAIQGGLGPGHVQRGGVARGLAGLGHLQVALVQGHLGLEQGHVLLGFVEVRIGVHHALHHREPGGLEVDLGQLGVLLGLGEGHNQGAGVGLEGVELEGGVLQGGLGALQRGAPAIGLGKGLYQGQAVLGQPSRKNQHRQ